MERRKQVMAEMGFKQSGENPSMLKAERKIAGMERVEEEKGLKYVLNCYSYIFSSWFVRVRLKILQSTQRCLVCHEGYTFKPRECMGIYVFCKETAVGDELEEIGLTTVTHFNIIHFSCHKYVHNSAVRPLF